jgi:hypothetical protein
MATVTFCEPGTDATQDTSFWTSNTGAQNEGTIASDTTHAHTGLRSIKSTVTAADGNEEAYVASPDGVCADAGTRISLWVYLSAIPAATSFIFGIETAGDGSAIAGVGVNSTGTLSLGNGVGSPVNGSTVLSSGQWYRLTYSYVITTANSYTFKLFINGVLEATMTGANGGTNSGTLAHTGSSDLFIGLIVSIFATNGAILTVWYDDIYVDNGSTLDDPGNISVTAKRAFANGTTNGFSTNGSASGYGSGNAQYVNGNYPLGTDTTTYNSVVVVASAITEEYTIEGLSVGDVNLTGATIKGVQGWIYASSTLTESDKIVVDGTQTTISVTSTKSLFTQNSATPTTYPAGSGTDIGMVTNATAATAKLFGAGVLVAYIPAVVASTQVPYQPQYFMGPAQGY